MIRWTLGALLTIGVIGVVVVLAARVAEPSVRPVLYPVSASPATTAPVSASPDSNAGSAPAAEPASGATTVPVATTVAPTATVPAPVTTVPPTTTTVATTTTTVATTTTTAPAATVTSTTTAVPTTTVPPPSTTAGMFGNLGAQLMAQLLGQPCIADGDLSDCGPEVDALVRGLVG